MIYISIEQRNGVLILDCHKGSEDGEHFQLIVDRNTKQLQQKPEVPDIDVSAAYSHIYGILTSGEPIPEKTVAAWG